MIETYAYLITGVGNEHIKERIEEANKKARKIAIGNVDTEEELELFFRMVIAKHRGVLMFDPVFEKYSLDELAFEAQILTFKSEDSNTPEQLSQIIEDNKEEAEDLFSDWEEEVTLGEKDFSPEEMEFMNSGKFVDT